MSVNEITYDQVINALRDKGYKVTEKRGGAGAMAQCPCHDDDSPSLAIKPGNKVGCVAYCFSSGCKANYHGLTAVAEALGLQTSSKQYIYRNLSRQPVVALCRVQKEDGKKSIPQVDLVADAPDAPIGHYEYDFYRSENIETARENGVPLYIVEGEKCADIICDMGYPSICAKGGSRPMLNDANIASLKGLDVILWQDNDAPGEVFVSMYLESIADVADSVTVVRSLTHDRGDDVEQHLEAGFGLEEAEVIAVHTRPGTLVLTKASNVKHVDIEYAVPKLVPIGEITLVEGSPSHGKTMVVCAFCATMSVGGAWWNGTTSKIRRTVYITTEDRDTVLAARLKAMGADLDNIYLSTDWDGCLTKEGIDEVVRKCRQVGAEVLVMDSFYDLFLQAIREDAPREAKPLLRYLRMRCLECGIAAVAIRHVTKASDYRETPSISDGYGGSHYSQAARSQIRIQKPEASTAATLVYQVKHSFGAAERPFAVSLVPCGPEGRYPAVSQSEPPAPPNTNCAMWLTELIRSGGGALPWRYIIECGTKAGFNQEQIWQTSFNIGVNRQRSDNDASGGWIWSL